MLFLNFNQFLVLVSVFYPRHASALLAIALCLFCQFFQNVCTDLAGFRHGGFLRPIPVGRRLSALSADPRDTSFFPAPFGVDTVLIQLSLVGLHKVLATTQPSYLQN